MAQEKPRWGRAAFAMSTVRIETGTNAGRRSLLLALGAAALVGASLTFLLGHSHEAGSGWAVAGMAASLAAFFVAAPVLLVMSLVAGLRGVFGTGGGRVAGTIGIGLSLVLLCLAIGLALIAFVGAGRVP